MPFLSAELFERRYNGARPAPAPATRSQPFHRYRGGRAPPAQTTLVGPTAFIFGSEPVNRRSHTPFADSTPDIWSHPTPDLFANTSLEIPRSPPARTRGSSRRRTGSPPYRLLFSYAQYGMEGVGLPAGARPELAASADRRADRLDAWRSQEAPLQTAFQVALQKYKLDSPAAFESFSAHMEYAALASTTPVRAHGIMLWFPALPKEVSVVLTALTSYYHGEARQMTDLYRKEGQAGSWTREEDLDDELVHAANMTNVRTTHITLEVTRFQAVGASSLEATPIKCPGFWKGFFMVQSRIKEDVVRALAGCEVARVYLDSTAALGDPRDGRWEQARGALITHCLRIDQLLQLPYTIKAMNAPAISQADRVFFAKAVKEITRIGEAAASDERLNKIAKGRAIAAKYTRKAEILAEAIAEEDDDVGDLKDECEEMVSELLELEDGEGGVGRVFGAWRNWQMGQ